ncbi:MAG TPA: hypothetical protein VN259_07615 [Xanthomonadales bacterium]|nr:hypothetical protein [Xanthomonadales bacterium]
MSTDEDRFWRDIVFATMNPGWTIALGDKAQGGTPGCARLTAAVYLVDTSSSWRIAGLVRPEDMLHIESQIRCGAIPADKVKNAAGWCVLENARPHRDADQHERDNPADAEHAVKLAIGALVQTQCYEQAKAGPGLAGHWLYLVYRMRDGSSVARPAMLPVRTTPFALMDPSMLEACISRIVYADTSASAATSSIAKRLQESGGAILAGDEAPSETAAERTRPER